MAAKFGPDKVVLPAGSSDPTGTREQGELFYNTTDAVFKYHDGSGWKKVSAKIPKITSISGNILNGIATTLTLTGEDFGQGSISVNIYDSGIGVDETVTVTPSSGTSATVNVPSAVYNNAQSGNSFNIKITNSDGGTSSAFSKAVTSLPSGGSISTSGNYRIHTFTSSGTFTNTISNLSVQYLVVAGGGGGGTSRGGGGGAGGYRTSVSGQTSGANSSAESPLTLSATSYTVTVGGGGGSSAGGGNSTFSSITSIGGGGGGDWRYGVGENGGSGGGSADTGTLSSGTSGQGYGGGRGSAGPTDPCGGGGGANSTGGSNSSGSGAGGVGGSGLSNNITGSSVTRAGGGGGGVYQGNGAVGGSGGSGGGGNGGTGGNNGGNGSTNTGGGGGGATDASSPGSGGSGIVIIRYDLTSI